MERIKSSETSAYKKQTPGNRPKQNIQHHEHGESLKSSILGHVLRILHFPAGTIILRILRVHRHLKVTSGDGLEPSSIRLCFVLGEHGKGKYFDIARVLKGSAGAVLCDFRVKSVL
jgi:hypothetical protein